MFPSRRSLAILILGLVTLAPVARADDLALYLERHGLDRLLATHLESRLDDASDDARGELLLRLADLYAALLGQTTDRTEQDALEQRGRQLLKLADPEETEALRFALLRASYQRAEGLAERHRLRSASDEELDTATTMFDEVATELLQLRERVEHRIERESRRRNRATGAAASAAGERVREASVLQAQSTFLAAWALYYKAWLNDSRAPATRAEELFAQLLLLEGRAAVPENVSVDRRQDEAFARCILGYALCRALNRGAGTALGWLALLEHESTFPALRAQVPAWELNVLLEAGEFRAVGELLDELEAEADAEALPTAWLRLVAVSVLEAPGSSQNADLIRRVITDLASRGALSEVFDLADRYGIDALGEFGFAGHYVRGILAYYAAREADPRDVPTSDPDALASYGTALNALRSAIGAPDGAEYERPRLDARRLVGWCHYFRGELLDARTAFLAVADDLPADQASDVRWMSILCLDELVGSDPDNTALRDELAQLIGTFLEQHPSSPHAGTLVLRRVITSGDVSDAALDELLQIPPDSDVHDAAQRRAAQILYHLFHDADPSARGAYGERFLVHAMPLLREDEQRWLDGDGSILSRVVTRGRRVLEVALHRSVDDPERAAQAMAILEVVVKATPGQFNDLASELDYRVVQIRLADDDLDGAERLADALIDRAPDDMWSRRATRALFRWALRRWRERPETRQQDRALADMIVRHGERILDEYADDEDAFRTTDAAQIAAAVAEASFVRWQRSREVADAERARTLYEALLELRPRNAEFLRAVGVIASERGDHARAVEVWRTLVSGLPSGTEGWAEARFHQASALAILDPPRALAVMDQHLVLYPDYGPQPWGARLRGLHQRLRAQREAGTLTTPETRDDA